VQRLGVEHVHKGYRGQSHPHKFRVWISGQVRHVTAAIRRESEMRRKAAVEPVIGHVKAEHRMGRNYLRWLAELLRFCALSSPHPTALRPSRA
jgi:hypothetical protein